MKQIIFGLLGVAAFIVLVGVLTQKTQSIQPSLTPTTDLKGIKVGNITLSVEVADSEEERKKGLSGRSSLEENSGMLFVFSEGNAYPSFWMKDMEIPLDIIWIDDEKVVKIDKNVSPPEAGTPDSSLTLYRPDKPIDYVLEVNGGFSDTNNIVVGNSLEGLP